MNIKELRVGNLVHAKNMFQSEIARGAVEVREILEYGINGSYGYYGEYTPDYYDDDIKGITLTEDWLIKLKFDEPKNLDEIDMNFTKQVGYRYKNDIGEREYFYVISSEVDDYSCYYYVTKKVEFVHQLQNLYFALTGQELTIDPSRELEH